MFVVAVALLGLLALLATLQYKWLGRISDAERDRMRATLNTRASGFAQDFDGELHRRDQVLSRRRNVCADAGESTAADIDRRVQLLNFILELLPRLRFRAAYQKLVRQLSDGALAGQRVFVTKAQG